MKVSKNSSRFQQLYTRSGFVITCRSLQIFVAVSTESNSIKPKPIETFFPFFMCRYFGFSLLSCVHRSAFSKFHQQSWDSGSWQTKIATVAKQTTNQKMKNEEWSWETTAIKSISYDPQSFVVSYNSQPCSSIVPKLKEIDLLYL